MSEKQDKRVNISLKTIFRRTVDGLLVLSLSFFISSAFAPDAHAKKKVPRIDIPATNGLPGTSTGAQYSIPGAATSNNSPTDNSHSVSSEIDDFNTHYGMPLWYISIPHPIPGIGRKTWCGPPIYVPIIGCLPWPKPTWCNKFPQCTATNVVNLIATLLIKHAYPDHQGRYEEHNRFGTTADFYYRDICINSAKIGFDKFNRGTGNLLATGSSRFDETSAGLVSGSKPMYNSCMPLINTPKFSPVPDPSDPTPVSPFAFYQNINNSPFLTQGADTKAKKSIYGTTHRYASSTFFLGGSQGCPSEIFLGTLGTSISNSTTLVPPVPTSAKEWDKQATRCYDYYISARALRPEWNLERPGLETDDPLTADAPRGNPALAIFNNCQPLMSGKDSELVRQGQTPIGKRFAPVLQYNRPDLDEADYDTAKYYRNDFRRLFPTVPSGSVPAFPNLNIPNYQNLFPCLETASDGGPQRLTDWGGFNLTLMVNYAISFTVETVVLNKTWGPMYFVPMPEDKPYVSPGKGKENYCPNVEKINIASNPFSPRDDFRPEWIDSGDKVAKWLEIQTSPYKYLLNHKITYIYSNDREYSNQTSFLTPKDRLLNGLPVAGYSDYNSILNKLISNPADVPQALINRMKYPEVMCAIVPVDILEPRKKAFDNCIMQRINYNFITWRRRNFLSFYYKRTLDPWVKPCATRFYESDDVVNCPVNMSIQQCCRIIVKDVVPMNHLKIRTCEGLRQKRNIVFGYDHIYDGTKKESSTTQDTTGIAAAQAKLDALRSQLTAYLGTITNPVWVRVSLCREGMNANGDTTDGNGNPIPVCTIKCNHCPLFQPTIRSYRDQISAAKSELKKAQNKFITTTTETDVPSLGGKYMKVNDKASYDAALKENQKLTLLGCDETEPKDYRFYHYFKKGNWPELPLSASKLLNDGINAMQSTIDGIMYKSQVLANKAILVPAQQAWTAYDAAIKAADNALKDAENIHKRVLYEAQISSMQYDKAKRELERLSQLNDISMLLMEQGNLPANVAKAVTSFTTSKARLTVLSVAAEKTAKIMEELRKAKDQVFRNAQDVLRKTLLTAEAQIQQNIIQTAKKQADDTAASLLAKLKSGPGQSVGNAIDSLYDTLNTSDNTALNTASATFNFSGDVPRQIVDLLMAAAGTGGAHMPYMRWWDTGTSAGNPMRGGSFINTLGSYDTIIGVGREERTYDDAENLTLDGNQPKTQTSQMGRINGWAGLKGHQMLTTRHSNLVCIGRHEKLLKFSGQENFVLAKAGGNYIGKDDGKQWPWPLGWRGFINDPTNEFEKNITATGLDNAEEKDIIIYKLGNLKRISYVTGVNKYSPKFVKIESWDQSKFPTSTGTGIYAGSGVERTIYYEQVPPGGLTFKDPADSINKHIDSFSNTDIAKVGNQPSCEDPNFTACVLGGPGNSTWDSVKIYRPSKNLRQCPYLDYSSASKNIQTSEFDTDSFSYCLNAGYDPPKEYLIGYSGPGTGAFSDLTRCGPNWNECSTTAPASEVKCFPNGDNGNNSAICSTPLPSYVPASDNTASLGNCTDDQANDAMNAYNAALALKTSALAAANAALEAVLPTQEAAEQAYNSYVNSSYASLAKINANIMQSQIPAGAGSDALTNAKNDLNSKIYILQTKQAASVNANQVLKNYLNSHKTQIENYEQIVNDYDSGDHDAGTTVPSNVQQAANALNAIHSNIETLQANAAAADEEVANAQTAVNNAQAAYNSAASALVDPTLAPDPTLVAQRDTINNQIATLQSALNSANTALANAQAAVDAAQDAINTVPPLKCPWP